MARFSSQAISIICPHPDDRATGRSLHASLTPDAGFGREQRSDPALHTRGVLKTQRNQGEVQLGVRAGDSRRILDLGDRRPGAWSTRALRGIDVPIRRFLSLRASNSWAERSELLTATFMLRIAPGVKPYHEGYGASEGGHWPPRGSQQLASRAWSGRRPARRGPSATVPESQPSRNPSR
jgi:hypothetical protein